MKTATVEVMASEEAEIPLYANLPCGPGGNSDGGGSFCSISLGSDVNVTLSLYYDAIPSGPTTNLVNDVVCRGNRGTAGIRTIPFSADAQNGGWTIGSLDSVESGALDNHERPGTNSVLRVLEFFGEKSIHIQEWHEAKESIQ